MNKLTKKILGFPLNKSDNMHLYYIYICLLIFQSCSTITNEKQYMLGRSLGKTKQCFNTNLDVKKLFLISNRYSNKDESTLLGSKNKAKIISYEEKSKSSEYIQTYVGYRKSGLSLNHIVGCPLNCGYCIRHFWGNFDMKKPQLLCSNEEAVLSLVNNKYFVPHSTPLQLFNKATDPFLPSVRDHTHEVLKLLDEKKLTNMILIITRTKIREEDMIFLESLNHLKISLFFTYSGIKDIHIEPISRTNITRNSIELASKFKNKVKTILYWRPLVPGWNDDEATMNSVLEIGSLTDAIVFTGYYHKKENDEYFKKLGVKVPYYDYKRRKVMPLELEEKVIEAHKKSNIKTPLFRKTSCGSSYVHGLSDYNGHWGIQSLCDICPQTQKDLCNKNYSKPTNKEIMEQMEILGIAPEFKIDENNIWTNNIGEDNRYYMQHHFGFQTWDIDLPHFSLSHGRADTGNKISKEEIEKFESKKAFFAQLQNIKRK